MRLYKQLKVWENILEKYICNMCGAEMSAEEAEQDCKEMYQFIMNFGYGSKKDGERWSFDLCEDCLDKITDLFKIPPKKENYL
jgi:hypothetical protein